MPWLEREHPELAGRYRRLYRGSNAPPAVRERIARQAREAEAAATATSRPGSSDRPAPREPRGAHMPAPAPAPAPSGGHDDPGAPPQQLGLHLGI